MNPKKTKKKISLFDLKVSAGAKKEVTDVLKSGWLSSGPKVAAFEKKLGDSVKVPNVCAVSSGTAGLFLTLKALDVKDGDEVITSPLTFVATIEVILHAGATPVLADIDPETLTISPAEIEKKITDKTKAVIPVDLAGLPADYESIRKVCQKQEIKIISDSAHSFGAEYNGKAIPNWTNATVFSFYSTKNITTADGGAVISNDQKLIDRIRLLSRHGLTSDAHGRRQSGTWNYDALALGYKASLSDVLAAIGLGELAVFRTNQKKKDTLVKRYFAKLKDAKDWLRLPADVKKGKHGRHLFIIQLDLENLKIDRDKFIELMIEKGIECGVHYIPVFELSYYSNFFSLNLDKYPNAHKAGERVVTLPLYPTLKATDVDYICNSVEEILKANSR